MNLRLLVVAALASALPIHEQKKRDNVVVMTTTQAMGWAQLFGVGSTTPVAANAATGATIATLAPTPPTSVAAVTTAAAAANVAATPNIAAAATTSSRGFLASLLGFFENESTDSANTATAVAATNTAASTATAPSSSNSSGSWFSNLILNLFGSSGTSADTTATAATAGVAAPSATSATSATAGSGNTIIASTASFSPMSFSSSASSPSSSSAPFLSNLFGSGSQTLETPGFTGLVLVIGAGSGDTGSESSLSAVIALDSEIAKVAAYAEEGAGITYSPYTKSGGCKSASQVALDIKALLAYSMIRLYSVDCSGIANVVSAMSSRQKLFLGVWDIDNLNNDLPSLQQQVLTGSRGWLAVHTVAIGNELVNSGTKTVAQIKVAMSNARSWFKSNAPSYSGYIVSVDTLAAVMADSSMCDISDYLAVNCHPYFSGIEALTSGTWLKAQVDSLLSHCNNGKQILITESGWPTHGNTVGQAVPSQDNQLLAIKGLAQVMGSQVVMFTTYNDYWKAPGPYNVEQNWGIYGDPSA